MVTDAKGSIWLPAPASLHLRRHRPSRRADPAGAAQSRVAAATHHGLAMLGLLLLILLLPGTALAESLLCSAAVGPKTRRAEWANDEPMGSDNHFTNGFAFQQHSALAPSLAEVDKGLAFGRILAEAVLPRDAGLCYRASWSLGQQHQTPEKIQRRELIADDVPFLSMVGWTNAFYAFDDERLHGFGWMVGWVGNWTLGKQLQRASHKELTNSRTPKGWDNQLANEPLINFYYARKHKLFNQRWVDLSFAGDIALGNFFTFGQTGLELRIGRKPQGFAYLPAPVGRGVHMETSRRLPGQSYFYISSTVRSTAIGFAMPRQGNAFRSGDDWTQQKQINPKRFVGQWVTGINYERAGWGLHLNFWVTTKTAGGLTDEVEDHANSFGQISVDWRF